MVIKSGIYTPKLKILRPVIKRWIELNEILAEYWKDDNDVPWWYNERALISVFAGSIWQQEESYET